MKVKPTHPTHLCKADKHKPTSKRPSTQESCKRRTTQQNHSQHRQQTRIYHSHQTIRDPQPHTQTTTSKLHNPRVNSSPTSHSMLSNPTELFTPQRKTKMISYTQTPQESQRIHTSQLTCKDSTLSNSLLVLSNSSPTNNAKHHRE